MLNLDTHILVHALAGNLTSDEERILTSQSWGISAIVFWEIAMLVKRGRVQLDLRDPDVTKVLRSIHVWPIDLAVAKASTNLDFRSDPADERLPMAKPACPATSAALRLPLQCA